MRKEEFTAAMRCLALAITCGSLLALGCRGGTEAKGPAASKPARIRMQKPVVQPDHTLAGKVIKANRDARFVVMNFPIGHLPALEQRLNVYRHGLKVGEVKITGPQREDNIVGDIVAGEAEVGDQVAAR